jgi:hypothetical protein
MSSGASKASKDAMSAAASDKALRLKAEEQLKRDRMKTQNLFIRQLRGQQGGGFFGAGPGSTLG